MTQHYDFSPSLDKKQNTSSKSVSRQARPSRQAIQNILNYARCIQQVKVEGKKIKLYLN